MFSSHLKTKIRNVWFNIHIQLLLKGVGGTEEKRWNNFSFTLHTHIFNLTFTSNIMSTRIKIIMWVFSLRTYFSDYRFDIEPERPS